MLITFAACGFLLHDLPAWVFARRVLPPGATIAFVFFALGAIASDITGMDIGRWPMWARAGLNLAYLVTSITLMLAIVLLIVH